MAKHTPETSDQEFDERELVSADELPFDPWEAEQEDGSERRRDPLRGPMPRRETVPEEDE
ncbi:MAG: hypothetical protein ACRD2J_12165 [Thermoanaerobaculia bacterium]